MEQTVPTVDGDTLCSVHLPVLDDDGLIGTAAAGAFASIACPYLTRTCRVCSFESTLNYSIISYRIASYWTNSLSVLQSRVVRGSKFQLLQTRTLKNVFRMVQVHIS